MIIDNLELIIMGNLKLSPLSGKGSVLQRGDTRVFGTAKPFANVTLLIMSREYSAKADAKGRFIINVGGGPDDVSLPPGGPYIMSVTSGGESITATVYVGDVWLCAGQSNMEINMSRVRHMYPDECRARNDRIRIFNVAQTAAFVAGQVPDEPSGEWRGVTPETVGEFSAAAYFFANKISREIGIPIGLIKNAVGGTPIAAWLPESLIEPASEEAKMLKKMKQPDAPERLTQNYERRAAAFQTGRNAVDKGRDNHNQYARADFPDDGWVKTDSLVSDETAELLRDSGIIWLRKSVDIPESAAGFPGTIFLGTVKDSDEVFIHYADSEGFPVQIGSTGYRYPPREYVIPKLKPGKAVITVRLSVNAGNGGFTKGKRYALDTRSRTDGEKSTSRPLSIDISAGWRALRTVDSGDEPPYVSLSYQPTAGYNGMVLPLVRAPISGILWYQGESDTIRDGDLYRGRLVNLVRHYRELWQNNPPFIYAEIAHYDEPGFGEDWDALRKAQLDALKEIPNSAMIKTDDIGEYNDLHPQSKRDVGERMAIAALELAYHKQQEANPFVAFSLK